MTSAIDTGKRDEIGNQMMIRPTEVRLLIFGRVLCVFLCLVQ